MPDSNGASLRLDPHLCRRLLDLSQDGLWALDAEGRLVYCSPSLHALRGFTAEEAVGQGLDELLAPECLAMAVARLEYLRQGAPPPKRRPVEIGVLCKDGSTVWVELFSEPIFEGGRLRGVIGVSRDISRERDYERRLREATRALEHALQAKDDFVGNLSHRLRTPMNGILGMIELLLESELSDQQRRYLETGRSAGRSLTAILDDLVTVSGYAGAGHLTDSESAVPPTARSALRPLSLLVAEDVEHNAKVIRAILEREGHRVTTVGNGRDAVAAAAGAQFDAVLMDVCMPEMDGVEATRRIRSLEGAAAEVPVLGFTANVMPQARDEYLAAGMDMVLLKPVEIEPLRRALAAVADGSARAAAAAAPAPAADAVLDRTWLDEMAQVLPPAQVSLLISKAGLAIAEHLGEIEGRLASDDMKSLAEAAHRLAGLAAMYGCIRLRSLALAVEDAARAGRAGEARSALDRLSRAVDEALAALDGVMIENGCNKRENCIS